MPNHARDEYKRELQLWLDNGWLLPYLKDELGLPKCLIPLMAVIQKSKQKVSPVLDYRKLNGLVDTYTTNSEECAQKMQ